MAIDEEKVQSSNVRFILYVLATQITWWSNEKNDWWNWNALFRAGYGWWYPVST